MASPMEIMEWCRLTCAGYAGVDVRDVSSSFRDGLAFCAIIHKHRPDLIDFSSLCKENSYENNKLAFEVAETSLGIPALLDPNDLVPTKAPDSLSVLTYISQYYYFFHGPFRSGSSHSLCNIPKSHKTPNSRRSSKSSVDLENTTEEHARTGVVCSFCLKPVHLIQRCLSDGKFYHRSCFRCKICHVTLLFDSRHAGSLMCSSHVKDSKTACADPSQRFRSPENKPRSESGAGFPGLCSLDGLPITSVPRYAQKAESQDRPGAGESRAAIDGEDSTQSSVRGGRGEHTHCADRKAQRDAVKISCSVTEGSIYPVPAPRGSLDSSTVSVPAPRAKTMSSSPSAEISKNQSKSPGLHVAGPKVKSNHPWMAIVHPGPWSQLPPAPPPVPLPRSKSTPYSWGSSSRPKMPPPNPFEEEELLEEAATPEETSAAAVQSENGDVVGSSDAKGPVTESELNTDQTAHSEGGCGGKEVESEAATPTEGGSAGQIEITPEHSASDPAGQQEANGCDKKDVCKENSSSGKPELSKSRSLQNVSSTRGPAPGHGFPLIRRKVQTDQHVSTEDLQKQRKELESHLEELEQQGVDLERIVRDDKSSKGEQMLTEWIKVFHERQDLLHKDQELTNLIKQQHLEDKQADVEYELRCLLNKPEKDWGQEDRSREQQLMGELVVIVEQRNQIISSLDLNRQRQTNAGVIVDETMKDRDLQKDGLKESKKSKGKFKPAKVFKMLKH
uniref:MICAL-like 1 n=2 Tax=Nothobranchius kuhntae TaxID=321403 RepID=A0A1A8JE00_NOTKU